MYQLVNEHHVMGMKSKHSNRIDKSDHEVIYNNRKFP